MRSACSATTGAVALMMAIWSGVSNLTSAMSIETTLDVSTSMEQGLCHHVSH
jgi:hypothetical protein